MDFLNIAKQRFSVRSYTDQAVEKEKLDKILEAAHVAPTAANLQPVHLIVVRSRNRNRRNRQGESSMRTDRCMCLGLDM